MAPAVEVQSLNHWTTKEFPQNMIFIEYIAFHHVLVPPFILKRPYFDITVNTNFLHL